MKFKYMHAAIPVVIMCLAGCGSPEKNAQKVLLVGLDGASWNIMQPLIDQGRLPNIKRLKEKGCWGALKTFDPLVSETIWTSIATGKEPGKHGIINRLMEDPDSGEYLPPTSGLRKVKAIWIILSEENKKVGVFRYLVTWPVEKVKGVMISDAINLNKIDYLSEDRSSPPFRFLCSRETFEDLKTLKKSVFAGVEKERFPSFLLNVEQKDNFTANFFKYLLRKENFEFSCIYLKGIDAASHCFLQYLSPAGSETADDDFRRYKEIINDYYVWCDSIIGDILKEIGRDTAVFVVSDHGFEKTAESGYLFSNADRLLEICGINEMNVKGKKAKLINEPRDNYSFIKNIRIIGNLSEEERGKARETAKYILKNIKVAETGEAAFREIKDTKSGFLIDASGLFMGGKKEKHILVKNKPYKIADLLDLDPHSGGHSRYGVIILSGKHILKNKEIHSPTIYDITPTILYYLGLPVAGDMDGRVLSEAIEKGYLRNNSIAYIATYEKNKKQNAGKAVLPPQEVEKAKAEMRFLGYLN
jgi:predicted AlkP superfamily phosphohydrolase/phosphomutase